jgi:hypothetical protein
MIAMRLRSLSDAKNFRRLVKMSQIALNVTRRC